MRSLFDQLSPFQVDLLSDETPWGAGMERIPLDAAPPLRQRAPSRRSVKSSHLTPEMMKQARSEISRRAGERAASVGEIGGRTLRVRANGTGRGVFGSAVDAATRTAERGSEAARRWQQEGLNGFGYIPRPEDVPLLARVLYSEFGRTPEDMETGGWTVINRIRRRRPSGQPEIYPTLAEVLRHHGAYSFMPNQGGNGPLGSAQWQESANPERLTGPNATAWRRAMRTAKDILGGLAPDSSGNSTFFFNSSRFDGQHENAPNDFKRMIRDRLIVPSKYRTPYPSGHRNYFWTHRQDLDRP